MCGEKTWTSALNGGADLRFSSLRSAGRSRDSPARGWAASLAGQPQTKCDNAQRFLLFTEAARAGASLNTLAVLCFTPLRRSLRRACRITHSCCSRTATARLGRPLHLSSPPQRPLPSTRPRHAANAGAPDPRRLWTDASLQQRFRNASQVFRCRRVEPTFPLPEGEPWADGAALV